MDIGLKDSPENTQRGAEIPPFSELYRGLDGDLPELRGLEEARYLVYYFCANTFGWDKKMVDSLPMDYLRKLFATHSKQMKESEGMSSMPRNVRKNFK